MPTTELGTHIWGADQDSEISDGPDRRGKTPRSGTRSPAAPAGSLPELEKRLAAEFRARQEEASLERRALIEGMSSALEDLRGEFEQRLEETLGEKIATVETGLREDRRAHRATGREVDQMARSLGEVKKLIEAIPADLRKPPAEEKQASSNGAGTARAVDRRIERLTKAVEALRADVQAGLTGKADLKDLRSATTLQRRQQKATSELRTGLAELSKQLEAVGKPRTAPRLAKDVEALERRVRSLEQAIPRKITATLKRRLDPLEEWLGEAVEEIRVRVDALDPERIRALLDSLERSANPDAGADGPRRRPRRSRRARG